jgi:hypothetical protein
MTETRRGKADGLIGLENLASLFEVEDFPGRVCLGELEELGGGLREQDAFATAGRHRRRDGDRT